jgi:hypothetical protein
VRAGRTALSVDDLGGRAAALRGTNLRVRATFVAAVEFPWRTQEQWLSDVGWKSHDPCENIEEEA